MKQLFPITKDKYPLVDTLRSYEDVDRDLLDELSQLEIPEATDPKEITSRGKNKSKILKVEWKVEQNIKRWNYANDVVYRVDMQRGKTGANIYVALDSTMKTYLEAKFLVERFRSASNEEVTQEGFITSLLYRLKAAKSAASP